MLEVKIGADLLLTGKMQIQRVINTLNVTYWESFALYIYQHVYL